jgi:hypothetical protein
VSIFIHRLGNEQGATTSAHLRHGNYEFAALVHGSKESLSKLLNQECLIEMSFERIASWRELSEFKDEQSCIKPSAEVIGAVTLRGRVHSTTGVDVNVQVVDLYLQTGPEFLAISSAELGGLVPSVGTALEVTVYGLCFYPTGT